MSSETIEIEEAPAPLRAIDRVRLARESGRPGTLDYIGDLVSNFVELHGDRVFGDDHALIGGIGMFRGRSVLVLGHQGGTYTREILTFIDTSGADPGIGSEERGQGTAIAESLMEMIGVRVPIVTTVIGEGGSGGALAISLGDRLLMLENAVYAVASPEACAAILWKDASFAGDAAETMRVTAADLDRFGMIDELIAEAVPAHLAPRETVAVVGDRIAAHLDELLAGWDPDDAASLERLLANRYDKFRRIGAWHEA
jgi:acetyl-CoA carboxylase carboxyl transferase subunit alpha